MTGRQKTILIMSLFFIVAPALAFSQPAVPVPRFNIGIEPARSPREVALSLQILLLLTVLTLAPSILIMMTSFIRIYVVLAFIPRALTTQNVPPNQVIIALSLFLTFFTMYPTYSKAYKEGVRPYLDGKITIEQGYKRTIKPIRKFMFAQTDEKYIYQFVKLAKLKRPRNQDDVPTYVLIPAFMLNELTEAFYMGAIILIPFVIIDIVVASVLMSMGMIMVPPVMISFPLKVIFFYVIDGWSVVVEKLVRSFGVM